MDPIKLERLKLLLGREPEVEKTRFGKYIAQYVTYTLNPMLLLADTYDEALEKLLEYLEAHPKSAED